MRILYSQHITLSEKNKNSNRYETNYFCKLEIVIYFASQFCAMRFKMV